MRCVCWEPNMDPLQEQCVFLTLEPSLQPLRPIIQGSQLSEEDKCVSQRHQSPVIDWNHPGDMCHLVFKIFSKHLDSFLVRTFTLSSSKCLCHKLIYLFTAPGKVLRHLRLAPKKVNNKHCIYGDVVSLLQYFRLRRHRGLSRVNSCQMCLSTL